MLLGAGRVNTNHFHASGRPVRKALLALRPVAEEARHLLLVVVLEMEAKERWSHIPPEGKS